MSADLRLGRWQDVLADIDMVDCLVTDPPYSARTHEGHDEGSKVDSANAPAKNGRTRNDSNRREITYANWTPDDVTEFVASWAPRCRGWFVAFTSHDLCPIYAEALDAAGRYVFAPLPWFSPGSRVRLSGDGPSSWTCWIMVARPRHAPYAKWGTLPGGYMTPPEACEVVGGKPLGLMRAIVRDYSRPGDLVCDPFVGSGTTAVAALSEGRRFVGSEQKPEHYEIARRRLDRGYTPTMF